MSVHRLRMRAMATLLLAAACSGRARAAGAELEALITDERLGEISGLAASRQHAGILWMHNDGDNGSYIYAVDSASGETRATIDIAGVRNVDWEDVASFSREGRHWLMLADIGDNGGLRRTVTLIVIEEPAQLVDARVEIAWRQRVRWPDGPRDSEAMLVDAVEGAIYLVSKKRVPPELFRVPLKHASGRTQTAVRVATLAGIEQPTPEDLERNPVYGRYRAQITAADLAADRSALAVMNYRRVYVYPAHPDGWGAAVSQPPQVYEFPWIPQAEALGFDRDGRVLWISSERLPAPLLRLPIAPK